MFSKIAQAAYAGLLLTGLIWSAIFCKLVHLLPLDKKTREGISLMLLQVGWRSSVLFSPWIRTKELHENDWSEIMKLQEKAAAEKKNRPLFVLGNHTSFFDTIFSVTKFPSAALWRLRTYMKSDLFNFPILGTVCRCVGHFAVHFASSEDGSFKVDTEKMAVVEKGVDEHLSSGGWLCFFPEGQVNKNPDQLMPLRYGGFKKALDFDANLVSFVTNGNPSVWPSKAAVGGLPGSITYSTKILAPNGAKAFAAEIRKEREAAAKTNEEREKIPADQVLLAEAVQELMQKQYDDLKAFNSGKALKKD
jgi:1-acyl-sn-glycerol-3-phosphate acyltransferase